jgi:hypothetical protein
MVESLTMTDRDSQRIDLLIEVDKWRRRWIYGQEAWSFAYHVTLFGAALLSLAAGFVVQLKSPIFSPTANETLATILAFVAAAFNGVSAVGGFEMKWRANRLSRGRIEDLKLDLKDPDADLRGARNRLKAIRRAHDLEILGGSSTVLEINHGLPSGKAGAD